MAPMADLVALATAVRTAPGLLGKRDLQLVTRLGAEIDGDDAALVPFGDGYLVVCGEAISPPFLAADPFGAGSAAVVTNVSDVRAMGGRPLALVDMLVSPDEQHAEAVLDGIAWAAGLLGVPVVGGHTTLGHAPALSASCTGTVRRPLRATGARAGDVLLAAFALDGAVHERDAQLLQRAPRPPPEQLREDGDALVEVAEARALPRRARRVDARDRRLAAADDRGRRLRGGARRRARPAARRRGAGALADDVPELRLPARGAAASTRPPRAPRSSAAASPARRAGASTPAASSRSPPAASEVAVWDLATSPLTGLVPAARSPSADG